MSISFMAALGGTLLAAVGTIAVVVRFARAPRADLIAWAFATAGLTVALAAQTLGYRRGFDPAMFRAVQIGAQLVAPLALAWGITEVAARSVPGRFTARLGLSALFAVSAVILSIDPLPAHPFDVSWPAASVHYQFPSNELLLLISQRVKAGQRSVGRVIFQPARNFLGEIVTHLRVGRKCHALV